MEPVKDFESFYASKIQPSPADLDDGQSPVDNWKRFTLFTGAGAFVCFYLIFSKILSSGAILAGTMLLMCITGVSFWTKYSERYIDDFKEKIIGQIITYIYPTVVYTILIYYLVQRTKGKS